MILRQDTITGLYRDEAGHWTARLGRRRAEDRPLLYRPGEEAGGALTTTSRRWLRRTVSGPKGARQASESCVKLGRFGVRSVWPGVAVFAGSAAPASPEPRSLARRIDSLRPGEYIWVPERLAEGRLRSSSTGSVSAPLALQLFLGPYRGGAMMALATDLHAAECGISDFPAHAKFMRDRFVESLHGRTIGVGSAAYAMQLTGGSFSADGASFPGIPPRRLSVRRQWVPKRIFRVGQRAAARRGAFLALAPARRRRLDVFQNFSNYSNPREPNAVPLLGRSFVGEARHPSDEASAHT